MAENKKRFSDEANIYYTYVGADELLENTEDLLKMINHHEANQRPRLKELQDYYEADNTTVLRDERRREDHLADHRATHAFAEYVSGFPRIYGGDSIKNFLSKRKSQ